MDFNPALRGTFDDGKPSLFELLSEQQLSSLLPPTMRYLLATATHRYPRHLLRVLNSFDELYALVALLVERHYLRTRGGSFTESFYGLKRECALVAEIPRAAASAPSVVCDTLRLTRRDVWRNLAVIVLVPYIKRKLDEAHEVDAPRALLGGAFNRLPSGAGVREHILYYYRCFLRKLYPTVNAAYCFTLLAFNLAYLVDSSRYHSPFLWLMGTRVRRMTAADPHAIEALAKTSSEAGSGIGSRLLSGLSLALPTSIFALKFLEWWYASDFAKQLSLRAAESLDLPPPIIAGLGHVSSLRIPSGEEEDRHQGKEPLAEESPIATPSLLPIYTVSAPEDSALCPICVDKIQTATACQTGMVYCYICIHKWLTGTHARQEKFMATREGKWESGVGRCAVTGRRVLGGTEGLRRIMV